MKSGNSPHTTRTIKLSGGTAHVREYSAGQTTWHETRKLQRMKYGSAGAELATLTCNSPGRFHGGAPTNLLTRVGMSKAVERNMRRILRNAHGGYR